MWYEVENGNLARPGDVDTTSSRVYVYVRRNIVLIEEVREEGEIVPAHYKWEEMKIPREMWDVCQKVMGHDSALDDVYDALTELAELFTEVM